MKGKSAVYYEQREQGYSSPKLDLDPPSPLSKIQLIYIKSRKKKQLWKVQPMLQKLSIAIAQLNLVNTFKILLNQIHELICSIDRSKEVTEKCMIITLKQHWLYKTEYLIH